MRLERFCFRASFRGGRLRLPACRARRKRSADAPGPLTQQAELARIVSAVVAKHAVQEQPDALADRQRLVIARAATVSPPGMLDYARPDPFPDRSQSCHPLDISWIWLAGRSRTELTANPSKDD